MAGPYNPNYPYDNGPDSLEDSLIGPDQYRARYGSNRFYRTNDPSYAPNLTNVPLSDTAKSSIIDMAVQSAKEKQEESEELRRKAAQTFAFAKAIAVGSLALLILNVLALLSISGSM